LVDYAIRLALSDQSLVLKIANKVGTTSGIKSHSKYITDLDFTEDIMLVSDNSINSQKQLNSVDLTARRVGLKINIAKTAFVVVGNWTTPIELCVSIGTINLVKDFTSIHDLGFYIARKILRSERH
jgi:hypothetical protein